MSDLNVPGGFIFPIGSSHVSRRSFLTWTTSLATAVLWSSRATGAVLQNPTFVDYPFTLGVASGDPTADGFVLWTRLAPKPLEGGGMPDDPVDVAWQVAKDEKMTQVVAKGSTIATPEWAHSVHVEVSGLEPDRWYYYQFKAGSEVSPVGRARTFPAANANTDKLRFAFASCQHYESGYYTAYEHMAKQELDLIAHLGDYIYEGAASTDKGKPRKHNSKKIQSLSEYRNRYGLYKADENLKAAHQAFPWIVTWDDHEVENNYANDISEYPNIDPAVFLKQRASAYQAYYEHMPLRRASLPNAHDMLLYRKLSFGPLADFLVLDTRQYRTDQPCGDGTKVPCEGVFDPKNTILGAAQKKWMFDELASSKAKWNVLAQQVMMARVGLHRKDEVTFSMDKWTGYEADRRQVLGFLGERKIKNPVVVTGDIHSHWANDLTIETNGSAPVTVAAEFVGTSITSSGDGNAKPERLDEMLSHNPGVKYHSQQRGYVLCEVTPDRWKTDFKILDYVSKPGSPVTTAASFVVEDGKLGLQKA